jgi:hypothetical protein
MVCLSIMALAPEISSGTGEGIIQSGHAYSGQGQAVGRAMELAAAELVTRKWEYTVTGTVTAARFNLSGERS